MKRLIRPTLILIIVLLLTFLTISLSGFRSAQPVQVPVSTGTGFVLQTATPQPEEDKSEIGSTDGITVMSFVIAAIIIIPIFLKRKSWSQA